MLEERGLTATVVDCSPLRAVSRADLANPILPYSKVRRISELVLPQAPGPYLLRKYLEDSASSG